MLLNGFPSSSHMFRMYYMYLITVHLWGIDWPLLIRKRFKLSLVRMGMHSMEGFSETWGA